MATTENTRGNIKYLNVGETTQMMTIVWKSVIQITPEENGNYILNKQRKVSDWPAGNRHRTELYQTYSARLSPDSCLSMRIDVPELPADNHPNN